MEKEKILLVLVLFLHINLKAQPKIPNEHIKFRPVEMAGVLYINNQVKNNEGNIQQINQFSNEPSAIWKFIPISGDNYFIQNANTGTYLGVNTAAEFNSFNGKKYFVYVGNNNGTDYFKWKVKFYQQRKPGMKSVTIDNAAPNLKEKYDTKYSNDDSYDIINIGTKSRLSVLSVKGLVMGDTVLRAAVDSDDRDEFGSIFNGKDANGLPVYKKTDIYVPRNNQARWQFFNSQKTSPKNTNTNDKPTASNNGNIKHTKIENPSTKPNENPRPIKPNNYTTLLHQSYALIKVETYSIRNGNRKKLPNLINELLQNKIEINFLNNQEANIKNTQTAQISNYKWELKEANILHLIPKNNKNNDATYIGELRFDENKIIHIVKEGKTETEYTYEKK
jgi:hypothetical protein